MSKSDTGLIIFATLLMIAITVSYLCKQHGIEMRNPFLKNLDTVSGPIFHAVVDIDDDNYDEWEKPTLPDTLRNVHQDDPELIEHIREKWILPPPSLSPRRLSHPEAYDHSKFGQSFVVDKLLKGSEAGFYVDSWAGDGETDSNTLFLEKDRRYDGILIEPNPETFNKLVGKRRHAYMMNACLSPTTTPSILNLTYGEEGEETSVNVQCFPVFSILAALGVQKVHYLSLSTEGLETDVLRTLPLGKKDKSYLDIDVFTVKVAVFKDKKATKSKIGEVQDILEEYDYQWIDAGDKINKNDIIMSKIGIS